MRENRLPNGRFKPGQSGNPTGRPRTDHAALRAQLVEHGPAVAEVVLKAALSGDIPAAKLILDRISPPLKAHAAPIPLDSSPPESLAGMATAFIRAAAQGQLPADMAAQLVSAVGTLARVVEIDEMKARLEALERALKEAQS